MEARGFDQLVEAVYKPSNLVHAAKYVMDPDSKVQKGILLCQGWTRSLNEERWNLRTTEFTGFDGYRKNCPKCVKKYGKML